MVTRILGKFKILSWSYPKNLDLLLRAPIC